MNGMILWFSDISVQSKFVFSDQTLKRCRFLTLHFAIWNQRFPTRDGNTVSLYNSCYSNSDKPMIDEMCSPYDNINTDF